MQLETLLQKQSDDILKSWFDLVMDSYPADTAQFFKNYKDTFANPVGSMVHKQLATLLEALIQDADHATLRPRLDPIIRIRAVQAFTPSQSVSFILALKPILRQQLHKALQTQDLADQLAAFDERIDRLCLLGFDIYAECREKIYELQVAEVKKLTYKAMERAGLVQEIPNTDAQLPNTNIIQ